MSDRLAPLKRADPVVDALIRREVERQEHGLEMIASENFVSVAVLQAMGTALTNKYAEGTPRKRYYGGCEWADRVENLDQRRRHRVRAQQRREAGDGGAERAVRH